MWIITNSLGEIVDRSSHKENLSRGYEFPGYKIYDIADEIDARLGDSYDGNKVTVNDLLRKKSKITSFESELIDLHVKKEKADALGYADLSSAISSEIDSIEATKTQVEKL